MERIKMREAPCVSSELIERARLGDQAAFTQIYELTSPQLYRTIHAMVRDEDLALDIQQDTYLRAWRSLDKLRDPDALQGWLRRIAVNVTATELSRQQALTFTELAGDAEQEPVLPDPRTDYQPELILDQKETARQIREIMNALSPEQQAVIGMFYFEGLSIKEISKTLRIAPGSVKTQLYRGRKGVETRVRAMERQGAALYGLSPLPYLLALLRRLEPPVREKSEALQAVLRESSGAPVTVTAATAGQVLVHSAIPKLLTGLMALALVGGGLWAGYKLLKRPHPEIGDYQPPNTLASDLTEAPATEDIPATQPSDLTEAPATEELPVTEPGFLDGEQYQGTCGENLTWRFDPDTGVLVIEGSGRMGNFYFGDIPWGNFREKIHTVSLPQGLTSVGEGAFMSCTELTAVNIPDTVTTIDFHAFSWCERLSEVTIPASVRIIGESAFSDCCSLTSVTVPGSVTDFGESAFESCSGLTSVTLGDGLTEVSAHAFQGCSSLNEISFPDSVTSLGSYAFCGCAGLTSVTIPAHVTKLGSAVFGGCAGLLSYEAAAENPAFMAEDGILFNKNGTALAAYPAGRTGSYAIPVNVRSIGDGAFDGCLGLTGVTIPNSVTFIGRDAFDGCENLTELTIPDSVTSIGDCAFEFCTGLTELTIPGSVASIGEYAFYCCEGLTELTLCEGVTEIGHSAFEDCDSLTEVTVPNTVTTLGEWAFHGCDSLAGVTLNEGLTSIGGAAFECCTALTGVELPVTVTDIGCCAFAGCTEMAEAVILNANCEIGEKAFYNCDNLTICGYCGSTAEACAAEYGIPFTALENP